MGDLLLIGCFILSAMGLATVLVFIFRALSKKWNLMRVTMENGMIDQLVSGLFPFAFLFLLAGLFLLKDFLSLYISMQSFIILFVGLLYFWFLGYAFDHGQLQEKTKSNYIVLGVVLVLTTSFWLDSSKYSSPVEFVLLLSALVLMYLMILSVQAMRKESRMTSGMVVLMASGILLLSFIGKDSSLTIYSSFMLGISLVMFLLSVHVTNIAGLTIGYALAAFLHPFLAPHINTWRSIFIILSLPLFNLLYVAIRRMIRGTVLAVKDNEDIWIKLKEGSTTDKTLSVLFSFTFCLSLIGLLAFLTQNIYFLVLAGMIYVSVGILIRKKPKKKGKMTVMTIFGTRPEAIKMAPVIKELEKNPLINSVVCVTGQHKEMLYQVLDVFNIKVDYDLDIMRNKQTLVGISSRILKVLEKVVKRVKPDVILVHGDTTSTFIGALLGFYMQLKVGHVEAGLRTYNKKEPFPEEINRVLTSALTDLHFAPSLSAKENLIKEGVSEKDIYVTGNTVVDSIKYTCREGYVFKEKVLNKIDFKKNRLVLMTAHRRENIGGPLEEICDAVKDIVERHKDVVVVYAVHKNPAVRNIVNSKLKEVERVYLIEPIDVEDMHNLMKQSYIMLTDSGGLQEEAPSFFLPTIVLRNVTERPEGLKTGILKLAGTERNTIFKFADELLSHKEVHDQMANTINPYGDGNASGRIVEAILYDVKLGQKRPEEYIAKY